MEKANGGDLRKLRTCDFGYVDAGPGRQSAMVRKGGRACSVYQPDASTPRPPARIWTSPNPGQGNSVSASQHRLG